MQPSLAPAVSALQEPPAPYCSWDKATLLGGCVTPSHHLRLIGAFLLVMHPLSCCCPTALPPSTVQHIQVHEPSLPTSGRVRPGKLLGLDGALLLIELLWCKHDPPA